MVKKVEKQKKRNTRFFFLFLVLLILVVLLFRNGSHNKDLSSKTTQNTNTNRLFSSKSLKFTVVVPADFQIVERYTGVTLANEKGKVIVDRNGTNFLTIDEYLNDLSVKNQFSLNGKQSLVINSLPAVKLLIENRMDYFIYGAEWTVYTLSTDSPELYNDLDQIAKSFRYLP